MVLRAADPAGGDASARVAGRVVRGYCRAVPRLWPAIRPRVPASGMHPRWKEAFLGEAFMWAFAAALATFAVTLSQQVAFRLIYLVLLLYVVRVFVLRRRPRAS